MADLVDTGGRGKLQKLFEELRERLPRVLELAGAEIAKQCAERAPSVDEEFQTMMFGGNSVVGSQDDGRARLVKPLEDYLSVFMPLSYRVEGLQLGIGNIADLDRISSYEYINLRGNAKEKIGVEASDEIEHVVTWPFWEAWENGGKFVVKPKFPSQTKGRGYPLKPTDSRADNSWIMLKSIPAHSMYKSFNFERALKDIIAPEIRAIINSAK
jgi:hypothetical protein